MKPQVKAPFWLSGQMPQGHRMFPYKEEAGGSSPSAPTVSVSCIPVVAWCGFSSGPVVSCCRSTVGGSSPSAPTGISCHAALGGAFCVSWLIAVVSCYRSIVRGSFSPGSIEGISCGLIGVLKQVSTDAEDCADGFVAKRAAMT